MTSKERLEAALTGKEVDRIPFSPFPGHWWLSLPKSVQDAGMLAFYEEIGADPLWRGAPCAVKEKWPGVEIRTIKDGIRDITETITPVGTIRRVYQQSDGAKSSFLIEHHLKTEEDFKVFLWVQEHAEFELNPLAVAGHLNGEGREGLSMALLLPVERWGKSAFQALIEHFAGVMQMNYALVDFPETVEALLQAMQENNRKCVKLAMESEYEWFLTWEDSGTNNMSPQQYEHYIAPEIKTWCDILRPSGKKYIQHACGYVNKILDMIGTTGIYGIESLSAPPTGDISLKDARAILGNEVAIIGGIEPTHLLNLSLEELDPYVQQVIEDGSGGPFVLANSDSCPPGVSMEKFKLICRIVRREKYSK